MKKNLSDGQIIEVFNPFLFFGGLSISICLMIYAIYSQQFLVGLASIAFAWQSGWGMSIKRFIDKENGEAEEAESME